MAALSPASHDRIFLFGLGLATCAVVGAMRHLLIYYRDAAAIPPLENKPQYITQDVEDSLKISTLDKLLDSPNYCIQETTSIIICERALHDAATIDALLWHITQRDHGLREQGIRALAMMMSGSALRVLNKPEVYAALVKSLEYCIDDYKHNEYDPEWDSWYFRDIVEQGCLGILGQLVDSVGPLGLIRSRFVARWLAKEPWGKTDSERQNNLADCVIKKYRLSELIKPLIGTEIGRRQLVQAGLMPPPPKNLSHPKDTRMTNGDGTAGEDFDGMFVENRRRREQSSVEEHIRRRHREAMVLNDGTRPFGREDIIQRERSHDV